MENQDNSSPDPIRIRKMLEKQDDNLDQMKTLVLKASGPELAMLQKQLLERLSAQETLQQQMRSELTPCITDNYAAEHRMTMHLTHYDFEGIW